MLNQEKFADCIDHAGASELQAKELARKSQEADVSRTGRTESASWITNSNKRLNPKMKNPMGGRHHRVGLGNDFQW
jgi:hypothetical protein